MKLRTFTNIAAASYAAATAALAVGVYLFAQDPLQAVAPQPPAATVPRVPFDCRAYRGDDDGFVCAACNAYHEARGETLGGQIAVVKVTIARMRAEGYPKSLCAVVWQPGQFSWTLEGHTRVSDRHAWDVAQAAAHLAIEAAIGHGDLRAYTPAAVDGATHYHAKSVSPDWGLKRVATIGNHIFYGSN